MQARRAMPGAPMTLYPKAKWRPLADEQPARMSRHDLVILHTAVGSLWGTDAYFMQNGYGGTESHFGVGYDGEVLQWVDLECRADANLDANDAAISIETADTGTGFPSWGGTDVPAWTDAQIEAIAQIVAWCCERYNIPCALIEDSRPGQRGVGWHRQGVESAPPYQRGYRVPGGEKWSTSIGKVCPGSRRIAQIPRVIARAQQILAGPPDPPPVDPDPPIPPSEEDDDDMTTTQIAILDDPVKATYSINWRTVQHVPDPSWQSVEQRVGLLPDGGASETINNLQFEWTMKSVLAGGGTVACPKHCGACLLETRWKAWADASNDRQAIANLQSTVDELADQEG